MSCDVMSTWLTGWMTGWTDGYVDVWVDRHECIERRSAAGIAKRATCSILINIGEEGTDSACRSTKTGNVRMT